MIPPTDNLPGWNGASAVYSKAYRVLAAMVAHGAVSLVGTGRNRKCVPSDDMVNLIDALASGDEERIKGLLLLTHVYPMENL